MYDDKKLSEQEIVTIAEDGKPSMEVIYEGPTQPEERVQFDNKLEETIDEAEEEPEPTKPEQSGFFARKTRNFIKEAIKQAKLDENEVPIGAVIVKDNKIIAKDHNRKMELNDPTAHAEILVLREAAKKLGDWHLKDCEIYITTEPCPMCLSAILQTQIKKIVFGCYEPRLGAVESKLNFRDFPKLNKEVEIIDGVLEEECKELLVDFFKRQRKKNKTII